MASLILHNIPESLLKRLQNRARQHERSVEEEVLSVLGEAIVGDEPSDFMEALLALRAQPYEAEDPYEDPFADVRDPSPGPEGPWKP